VAADPGLRGSGTTNRVRAILVAVRNGVLLAVSALLPAVSALLVACGGETVVVSGTVQYDDHTTGDIVLRLVEDETCHGRSCQTPGEVIASTRLSEPGPFTLQGEVDDHALYVYLLGYALGEATDFWDCEAGGAETFDVANQHDVILVLERDVCPALD